LCSQALTQQARRSTPPSTPQPNKSAASTDRTASKEHASSAEKLSAAKTKMKKISAVSTEKTTNDLIVSAEKTRHNKKKSVATDSGSSPSSKNKQPLNSGQLKTKSFKHLLMRPLKAFVYGSGHGHRITDGSLPLFRELRWNSFIDAVKAYNLGGFRTSIDELTVSDAELKLHISHSVYDMFNTTLKVIPWQQCADSVWQRLTRFFVLAD